MMSGHHTGQTLNDRLNAARYALAGQGLARVVCKATTEELIAPKKKHIEYLLQCTNEPNVSIPQLANLLIERTQHSSWIVVFKALITVHHLMCYGNERFTQYLASSNSNFQLSNYLDKNAPKGYDMSIFIRRYARYINSKALSYRTVAFDFTKVKREAEGNQLRQMGVEKLMKIIPVLQGQIDALLEFDCNPNDLNNSVINSAFFLLFKDLIRLFACYNDGIINCLEKYFELTNKKLARESLEIYKKFLSRMNKVADCLKVAENVGIDRVEVPDLTKAPSSLLEAMEQHLAALEGKKPGTTNGDKVSDETSVKKAIEEEEQFLNKLKEKHLQEKKVNNPFLPSSPNKSSSGANQTTGSSNKETKPATSSMIDFLLDNSAKTTATINQSNRNMLENAGHNEDLFSLDTASTGTTKLAANNPFADILSSLTISPTASTGVNNNKSPATAGTTEQFATSDGFAAAFGNSSNSNIGLPQQMTKGFDAFGDVLQPQNVSNVFNLMPEKNNNLIDKTNNLVPTLMNTTSVSVSSAVSSCSVPSTTTTASSGGSIVKGDLDASLANLAENLSINSLKGSCNYKKGQQFNQNEKNTMKTGGSGGLATSLGSSISTNISSNGTGGTGGNISPNSAMIMRGPSQAPPARFMPATGWNSMVHNFPGSTWTNNPMMPSTMVAQPINTMKMTPLMPMIGNQQPGQPMMLQPNTFAMRPSTMMGGGVPLLPTNVTASTLSSILSGQTPSNTSKIETNNNQTNEKNNNTSSNNQSIDPFGAF